MSTERRVFYHLLTSDGHAYEATEADSVECSHDVLAMRFADAVWFKNAGILHRFSTAQLKVYLNKESLQNSDAALDKAHVLQANQGSHPLDPLVVVVPDPLESTRLRTGTDFFQLGKYPTTLPTMDQLTAQINPVRFVFIEKDAFEGSGIGGTIGVKTTDIVVYLRDRYRDQVRFIRDRIERCGGMSVIHGPPGTGKSITAYMSALVLAAIPQGPIVLWVHIDKSMPITIIYECVLIHNGSRRFAEFSSEDELNQFLSGDWGIVDSVSKRALFIDGFVKSSGFENLEGKSFMWMKNNQTKNHLIFLMSMGSSHILSDEGYIKINYKRFKQFSWTLEEYEAALTIDEFRRNVSPQLAPRKDSPNHMANAEENMRIKFYYAGGSPRFMFQICTEVVKSILDRHICDDNNDLYQLTTALRRSLPHTLFSEYRDDHREIVSQYVKHRVSMRTDIVPILSVARDSQCNFSLTAWMFEEFILKQLWIPGLLKLKDVNGDLLTLESGTQMWYIFNPEHLVEEECPINEWLRPMRYNHNGGFDGVRITPRKPANESVTVDVSFIQCTVSKTTDMKLIDCFKFLRQLEKNLNLKAVSVKYHLMVPEKNLGSFCVPIVTAQSPIEEYGWSEDSLLVHGIQGWINNDMVR